MKSKSNFLFLLVLVFSAYSCSPKGDGTVSEVIVNGNTMYVFSLNELKADTVTLPLSSLVENCVLVQLETRDDAFFTPGATTVTEKYIGVRSRTYMLFDRSGKFLCPIGAIGQGPGEYAISLYDDIIDDKNDLVYLGAFMENKIMMYNTSGKFIKDIVAPHSLQKPKMFLSDGILTVVHLPFEGDKAVSIQFDAITGEVLKELSPPPAHLIVQSFDSELMSTRNALGVFDFLHTSSDTLYHFDVKNNEILPAFMVKSTKEGMWKRYYPLNKNMFLTNVNMFDRNARRFVSIGTVATDLKSKTSSWINGVNDYFGNMSISIGSVSNGYWVQNIQPEQLIEDIKNRLTQRNCTEKDKQVLNKTLSTLKENENNVVFIGKLKKEITTKLW